MLIQNYDLVLVKWTDAHSEDGWTSPKDLDGLFEVNTVGVVVKETDEAVYIAGSFGCYLAPEDDEVATTMAIPKGMIKSRTTIRKNLCGKRAQDKLHSKPTTETVHRKPGEGGPVLKPNG